MPQKKDCRLGGQNALFRKKAVLEAGKLIPELGSMCDWFLILTLAFRSGICFIPEPLTKLRIHKNSYSQRSKNHPFFCRELLKNLDRILMSQDFKDVRSSFVRTGVIYQLGLKIFPELFSKKYSEFVNFPLCRHLFVALLKTLKHKSRL